jgi:hypothetical protein
MDFDGIPRAMPFVAPTSVISHYTFSSWFVPPDIKHTV